MFDRYFSVVIRSVQTLRARNGSCFLGFLVLKHCLEAVEVFRCPGSIRSQQLFNVSMSPHCGPVKAGSSIYVLNIHISIILKENLHDLSVTFPGG